MIDKILILSQERFERSILPKVDELSDTFFISILDPDTEDKLREDSINFKTWKFYDLEEDINTYKAISFHHISLMLVEVTFTLVMTTEELE